MNIPNQKFSDYVTSGAFNLSLSRNQIGELAMLGEGPASYVSRAEALERRGLIEAIPAKVYSDFQSDMIEYRLTSAGILVVQLIHAAGLTNSPPVSLAVEGDRLRSELVESRAAEKEANRRARSLLARLKALQLWISQARSVLNQDKIRVRVLPRDPMPEVCTSCHEKQLEGAS